MFNCTFDTLSKLYIYCQKTTYNIRTTLNILHFKTFTQKGWHSSKHFFIIFTFTQGLYSFTLLKHTTVSTCSFPLLVIRPLCFSCWNLRTQRKPTTASMASTLRTVSGVSIISSTTTWRNHLGAALPDSLPIFSQKLLLPTAYAVAPNTVTNTSIYNRKQPHRATRNHQRMMSSWALQKWPTAATTVIRHSGERNLRGNWEMWD